LDKTGTLGQWCRGLGSVPGSVAWYLSDLGESRGRQELFSRQSPQVLKALREHAMVESTVSSNRIEGVEVERSRVGTLVFGRSEPRDRNEEELRGYRLALEWIHTEAAQIPLSEDNLKQIHRRICPDAGDAGRYKNRDGDIVETYPDGRSRVRFRTVPAKETPRCMKEIVSAVHNCTEERWAPALLCLAAFNLDFLCVHPFRDGNGRVSRLLLLLQLYRAGCQVGRYISLERIIEQNKAGYYEALELSSKDWHQGRHDPWPYVIFLCSTIKEAYRELEQHMNKLAEPRGAKTARVLQAVEQQPGAFRVEDLRRACPGVGDDTIRRALKALKKQGRVVCLGRGPAAKWRQVGKTNG